MKPFDVSRQLPTGTTVLEASAGTGKTFTIAALAVRFLAEGRASCHADASPSTTPSASRPIRTA